MLLRHWILHNSKGPHLPSIHYNLHILYNGFPVDGGEGSPLTSEAYGSLEEASVAEAAHRVNQHIPSFNEYLSCVSYVSYTVLGGGVFLLHVLGK